LPQGHITREKTSYRYCINTGTDLFLELNGRYLEGNSNRRYLEDNSKVLKPNFLKRIVGKVNSNYKMSSCLTKRT